MNEVSVRNMAIELPIKKRIILHLCADIGSDSQPYREAGYDVRCIGKNIGVENYHPPPENVYGIIANPPCTMFSIARTKAKTPRDLKQGMVAVHHCVRIIHECIYKQYDEHSRKMPVNFWVIENPGTGYLKWFLGQPRFEYCPSWYGGTFTKRTALWGQFNIPKIPFMESVLENGVRSLGGNYGRNKHLWFSGDEKAVCEPKFAKAFFMVNQ